MKTSEKLRQYFGSPSTMLEPLLREVELLERECENTSNEFERIGKFVAELGEGCGVARGVDTWYLVENVAGNIKESGDSPGDVIDRIRWSECKSTGHGVGPFCGECFIDEDAKARIIALAHTGPEFDQGERDPLARASGGGEFDE